MTKLHYSPGACSLAIHVLLEEIGAPYELSKVNFAEQQQHSADFKKLNPKSKVPTLERDDGSVLTELPAIAWWLAMTHPEKGLLPADAEGQARLLEMMDYIVATTHMQGFTRYARPGNFSPREEDFDTVKTRGLEIFHTGLGWLDGRLGSKTYVLGDFSLADIVLFYPEYWTRARLKQDLPENLARHYAAMMARPAVKAALEQEGLSA